MHGREQKFIQVFVRKLKVMKPPERIRHTWEGSKSKRGT
jgi:hypothetical protein